MPSRALVVDANILVRAVLGKRVREVFEAYAGDVSFFVPDSAMPKPKKHLAALVVKRGGDPEKALALLRSLGRLVERIGREVYGKFEVEARERLARRDPEDWPMLAAALALGCAIWTEDTDFFGGGVATWTVRPRPDVLAGMIFSTFSGEVRTLHSCPECSIGSEIPTPTPTRPRARSTSADRPAAPDTAPLPFPLEMSLGSQKLSTHARIGFR